MSPGDGSSAADTARWIDDVVGWRVDVEVVSELLHAVDGDRLALERALRRADDPTDLLARPHRPLDVLSLPDSGATSSCRYDGPTTRVALLHALGDRDVQAVAAALSAVEGAELAQASALDARLLRRAVGGLAVVNAQTAARLWDAATDEDRRWALATLATHTDRDDSRAWYRAWASLGPDAEVADALITASEVALARGDTVEAASALEIAAALMPDPDRAVALVLRAAGTFFVAGRPRHALALLRRTLDAAVDPASAATVHRMIGRLLLFDGDLRGAEAHLLAHAPAFAADHEHLGLLLAAEALWVRAVDGRLAEGLPLIADHGEPGADAPLFVRSCWTGLRNMLGSGVERDELEARHGEFSSMPADDPENTMVGYVILHAAIGMEAYDIADDVLATLLHRQIREGVAANRALVLAGASELAWWRGDWVAARSFAREAVALAGRRHDTISPARAVLTLARLGVACDEADAAHALVDEHIDTVPGWSRPALLAARGHGHLVQGQLDRAIADLTAAVEAEEQPGWGLPHPKLSAVGPDRCSALVAAGRHDEARAWLARWRSLPATGGRWERGVARRCDALLADGDEAIATGAESVDLLEGFAFDQAIALLDQGDRCILAGDVDEARRCLRAALPRFVGLGATTWVRRTEGSLQRIAGTEGVHLQRALARLSPQDRQIATCVAAGSTNRQVAEALHLSPKTVENRLTAIYAALGVRNRVELARQLAA